MHQLSHPRSPYAVSKVAAHWYAVNYREAYGMFIACGILFNHESPASRRNLRHAWKIYSAAAARISLGLQDKLYLGNLEARQRLGLSPGITSKLHVDDAAGGSAPTIT